MEEWWNGVNQEEVYFICSFDWSGEGYEMPYATEVDGYYGDFGNGYVPFFAVIGAYNVYMYGGNDYPDALNTVPEAIDSFNYMGVLDPIPNQNLYLNEEVAIDVEEMFAHPDDLPITVTVADNTNPEVVDAEITDNTLNLAAGSIAGEATITLNGEATNGDNLDYSFEVQVMDPNASYVVIVDLDPTSTGSTLASSIENYYSNPVHVATSWDEYPLANADALFILLGVYNNNYALTEGEVAAAVDYLDNGGSIYMEGGDTWAYDSQTSLHDMFNINGTSDGSGDLNTVTGENFLDGLSWTYSGENNYIDHLAPTGDAEVLFSASSYDCGIVYDSGSYKTIGTSFEITGLGGTNSLDDAIERILDFMIEVDETPPPQNLTVIEENYNEALLSWQAPNESRDLIGYNLYLDSELIESEITETTYNYSDGLDSGEHEFAVSAVFDAGESEQITATLDVELPSPGLNEAVLEGNNVQLTWTIAIPNARRNSLREKESFARSITGFYVYRSDQEEPIAEVLVTQYTDELDTFGTYEYWVVAKYSGNYLSDESNHVTVEYTTVDEGEEYPLKTELVNNYPNPFNPKTEITYSLKESGRISIEVYNAKGQKIKVLVNDIKEKGVYSAIWNGRNENGKEVPSGIYFYRMKKGRYTSTKKMILLK